MGYQALKTIKTRENHRKLHVSADCLQKSVIRNLDNLNQHAPPDGCVRRILKPLNLPALSLLYKAWHIPCYVLADPTPLSTRRQSAPNHGTYIQGMKTHPKLLRSECKLASLLPTRNPLPKANSYPIQTGEPALRQVICATL